MNNDYSDLTNEELINKLKSNIEETDLITKEMSKREKNGSLKRRFDAIDDYMLKKHAANDKRSA